MAKLTIQAMVGGDVITGPDWLVAVGEYNFLFASGWLLGISVSIVVFVSLFTAPPDKSKTDGLTFSTISAKHKEENRASWNKWDVIATVFVLGLVLAMYLYFSFWLK